MFIILKVNILVGVVMGEKNSFIVKFFLTARVKSFS